MSALDSLRRIHALAWNGHRQAVRDKVLHVLGGFGVALILGSVLVSQLTVGERTRIVTDLGLSAIAILSVLTATFVTVNQASREIERRTVDIILAKPVARWELVAGRFAGLAITLALLVAAMGAVHAGVLATLGEVRGQLGQALLLTWVEALVVGAIALFLSTFTTPIPAIFATLGVAVIGHTSWGLVEMSARMPAVGAWLMRLLYVALPNLELLNVRSQVAWNVPVPWDYVLRAACHGAGWCGLLCALSALVLAARDLR